MYTNTKAERVFMARSFLFHTPKKSFYDRVIYIVESFTT